MSYSQLTFQSFNQSIAIQWFFNFSSMKTHTFEETICSAPNHWLTAHWPTTPLSDLSESQSILLLVCYTSVWCVLFSFYRLLQTVLCMVVYILIYSEPTSLYLSHNQEKTNKKDRKREFRDDKIISKCKSHCTSAYAQNWNIFFVFFPRTHLP